MGVVEVIARHITHECVQCSARGFLCEMCHDETPIYAFDILKVAACRGCNTFVHRKCIAEGRACRKCARLQASRKVPASSAVEDQLLGAPMGIMADSDADSFLAAQTRRLAEQKRREPNLLDYLQPQDQPRERAHRASKHA